LEELVIFLRLTKQEIVSLQKCLDHTATVSLAPISMFEDKLARFAQHHAMGPQGSVHSASTIGGGGSFGAVAHSPVLSTVRIMASSKGEHRRALAAWKRWCSPKQIFRWGIPGFSWMSFLTQCFSVAIRSLAGGKAYLWADISPGRKS
jgi:hypothetical protein